MCNVFHAFKDELRDALYDVERFGRQDLVGIAHPGMLDAGGAAARDWISGRVREAFDGPVLMLLLRSNGGHDDAE